MSAATSGSQASGGTMVRCSTGSASVSDGHGHRRIIHFSIMMIKLCNGYGSRVDVGRPGGRGGLGIRPLNARSLAAVGAPRPAGAASGDRLDVASGTALRHRRRHDAHGDLADAGHGRARGRRRLLRAARPLIERKRSQDVGRRPPGDAWNGDWWLVTVVSAEPPISPSDAASGRRWPTPAWASCGRTRGCARRTSPLPVPVPARSSCAAR